MYWSYKSLPELKDIEVSEARKLFKQAWKIASKRPGTGKAVAVLGFCAGIGTMLFGPIGGGIGGGIGGAYYGQVLMSKTREVLQEMGYPRS